MTEQRVLNDVNSSKTPTSANVDSCLREAHDTLRDTAVYVTLRLTIAVSVVHVMNVT